MSQDIPAFDRHFFDGGEAFSRIGSGDLGGKAAGLVAMREVLRRRYRPEEFPAVEVVVPTMTVVATDVFDRFMVSPDVAEAAAAEDTDERIAHAFQRGEIPVDVVGDLRALVEQVRLPLAVRSSSRLEDALMRPFAGVYETKMIPNNQADPESRFRRLSEAIKLVWASTFFREARGYIRATDHDPRDEKMAVVVQEVVGLRHGDRFYPDISGVARSYDYYPLGDGLPSDGVVQLALGLGKTIVDGGVCWTYSPARPRVAPPFASVADLLDHTQSEFWAVHMGRPPAYDPIRETEYLVRAGLADAEMDDTLGRVASTYDARSDRLTIGIGAAGPRALTFAPVLALEEVPLNAVVRRLLAICEDAVGQPVEMEFAVTLGARAPARFGLLQVRAMVVPGERVDVGADEMGSPRAIAASERTLGNGIESEIRDVVYVKPETFEARHTRAIAGEVAAMNDRLVAQRRPYLLIGFGRWGSVDPWLGIPVGWGQIAGARAIIEATLPSMNVEFSQGSHFFHNMSSFRVGYMAVHHDGPYRIDWAWLERQPIAGESAFVRHVSLTAPVTVKLDGVTRRGVVLAAPDDDRPGRTA